MFVKTVKWYFDQKSLEVGPKHRSSVRNRRFFYKSRATVDRDHSLERHSPGMIDKEMEEDSTSDMEIVTGQQTFIEDTGDVTVSIKTM